jgi:hypothetical protein
LSTTQVPWGLPLQSHRGFWLSAQASEASTPSCTALVMPLSIMEKKNIVKDLIYLNWFLYIHRYLFARQPPKDKKQIQQPLSQHLSPFGINLFT